MVEFKGRIITNFFKAWSQPKKCQTDNIPSSSLTPLSTQDSSTILPTRPSLPSPPPAASVQNHEDVKVPQVNLTFSSSLTPLSTPELNKSSSPLSPPPAESVYDRVQVEHVTPTVTQAFSPIEGHANQKASFDTSLTQDSNFRSSQRVIRNGDTYILNSDEESDLSLQDLDEILNRRRAPESPKTQNAPSHKPRERRDLKRKRSPPPFSAMPRLSLKDLAAHAKNYQASKEDITRTKDLLEAQSKLDECAIVDSDLVNELMQNRVKEEDTDRLKLAIMRTDALQYDLRWSFFDDAEGTHELQDCPDVGECGLASSLLKPAMRQQTFLSGFVEDFMMQTTLPNEMLSWILDAACLEPREDIRQAYTQVVKQTPVQFTTLLSVDRLADLFLKIGACRAALLLETPVDPLQAISNKHENIPRASCFLPFADILHLLAPHMENDVIIYIICLTCRLLMDTHVTSNGHLVNRIEHLLTDFLSQLLYHKISSSQSQQTSRTRILCNLYRTTNQPQLRVLLLRNLPVLSLDWLHIRRHLALSWFLSVTPTPNSPAFSFDIIMSHLSSTPLMLNNTTNFSTFTPLIQILNIALDSCDRPNLCTYTNADDRRINERKFNSNIDAITSKLRAMFLTIIDSGASDLRRTEAKEALEELRVRLLYTVRTRPPAKKSVFNHEGVDKMRTGIEGWMGMSKGAEGREGVGFSVVGDH